MQLRKPCIHCAYGVLELYCILEQIQQIASFNVNYFMVLIMCLIGHGSINIPVIILSVHEFLSSAVIHSSHNKLSLTGQ